MNGGYIMVDCKGLDLQKGSTPQTITGLYEVVKASMSVGKPIYACNCTWGDVGAVTPVQTFCIDFTDVIIATASTLQIVITPQSVVTIVNMAPTEG